MALATAGPGQVRLWIEPKDSDDRHEMVVMVVVGWRWVPVREHDKDEGTDFLIFY